MAKTDYKSVDEYMAAQPEAARSILEKVRGALRKALPDAAEVISYQIPAYKMPGGGLYFSGWKQHYSLYPANDALVAAFKDELAPYKYNGKGTLSFPLSEPVPEELIGRLARFHAERAAESAKAKKAAKTKK